MYLKGIVLYLHVEYLLVRPGSILNYNMFQIWQVGLPSSMNLGRHSISSTNPVQLFDARFDADCKIFTTAAQPGFAIYRAYPLQLIRKRGTCSSHQTFHPSHFFHRVTRWNTYCGFTFACHKYPLSFGWRSQSSISSKQGYPLERYSG